MSRTLERNCQKERLKYDLMVLVFWILVFVLIGIVMWNFNDIRLPGF